MDIKEIKERIRNAITASKVFINLPNTYADDIVVEYYDLITEIEKILNDES